MRPHIRLNGGIAISKILLTVMADAALLVCLEIARKSYKMIAAVCNFPELFSPGKKNDNLLHTITWVCALYKIHMVFNRVPGMLLLACCEHVFVYWMGSNLLVPEQNRCCLLSLYLSVPLQYMWTARLLLPASWCNRLCL